MMASLLHGRLWSTSMNIRAKAYAFATHYHELNEMEKSFKRIKNYNVSGEGGRCTKSSFCVLERGGEHSLVSMWRKWAGMPGRVSKRANDILHQLR